MLSGNQQTQELGESQQHLSSGVDEFIAYIEENLADPHGKYNLTLADLRDAITTLGVVAPRYDELLQGETVLKQEIEKMALWIQQDAKLWAEIGPIAERYGAESAELAQFLQSSAGRKEFLSQSPQNGSAIDVLQEETLEQRNVYQAQLGQVQGQQAQDRAQASAAIAQANWYEQRAAYHWGRSRKNGPTWTEWRKTWKRGRSGKKKSHWVQLTHVDHDWILWDTYTKYAQQLRAQGVSQIESSNEYERQEQRLEPIAEAWIDANNAANLAEPPIKAARNLVEVLKATREQIPAASEQLQILEDLLPEVQQKLAEAQQEADEYNAKVLAEWQEYDSDAAEYMEAISDVLARRAQLNQQSMEVQHQLAETEGWVERQSVALETELTQVQGLRSQMESQMEELTNRQATATPEELTSLQTMRSQLEQSLPLLESKAAVLTAQQTVLTQKRTLLTAQNEVIIAEQRLLDAYLVSPDEDTSTLQQQLADARAALAEAQRLAAQAEASSNILTAPLQELQTNLLAQNDSHLQAAKAHQAIIKELLEATELNANYTLEAAQQQQAVNDLEFQILQRLQEATAAGSQEALHLLDVAKHNDIATAAEIWYRDYKDIASDKGGSCAGGIARAEDRRLADQYYGEMLRHRELQSRAQDQANHFRSIKETAEAQMTQLQEQQSLAQQLLDEANAKIAQTSGEVEAKQQELEVAQARLDGITRIRESTEQTFVQLVALEKLNLAQAQLEQQIAAQRQADIEQAVDDRIRREQLELERQRKETQAKLEQLQQLQVEAQLQETLNDVRSQVGLETLEVTGDSVQRQTQMASLLRQLEALEGVQFELPDDLKALLEEVKGDIHLALQGEEAASIQENLLRTTTGLIGQVQHYQTEIARLELEEQWDAQLLQLAQQDVQQASQQLLAELERAAALGEEQQLIEPLYLETLAKVAHAEQAVDISQDLAAQSREFLEQIIDQRVAERKARKKFFWNDLLGTVSTILSILGTVVTIVGGPLAPLGIALTAATAAINAVYAAINGDWLGAIFTAVMGGFSAITGGLAQAGVLSSGTQLILQKLQSTVTSAYSGVRSIMSGDGIKGFLQILSGVASVAITQMQSLIDRCATTVKRVMYQVVNSLQSVPLLVHNAIEGIENNDWFSAINNIVNAVGTLGQNFSNAFNSPLEDFFGGLNSFREGVEQWVNTGKAVYGAIKEGGLTGVWEGIDSVLKIWQDDLTKFVSNLVNPPKYQKFQTGNYNQEHEVVQQLVEKLYDREGIYDNGQKTLIEGLPGTPSKFEILDKVNDNDTGFDAFLVEEKDTGKRIIVFRGTEPKKLADILSDLHPGGVGYNQLSANLDKVGTWINNNAGVTLTGHSLGGALTQFAAVKFPENVGEVVTFNSPGLSGAQLTSTNYQHFKANNPHIKTTHYVVEKDAVSMAGSRFIPGDVYLMRQPDGDVLKSHGLAYDGIGRVGHPDISFTKISTDELNDPEFAYSFWPQNAFNNKLLNVLTFPALHLLGRERQTAEFTRTMFGLLTGTGLVHSR